MDYEPIAKPHVDQFAVRPNLDDYERIRASFDYERVIDELDGLPGGGLNIAYEALDRHVARGRSDKACLLWESKDGRAETYTYADMARLSNRFANALKSLGVAKGDRVFVFMDRIPELYAAAFGTLKAGCIIGPLFSAFGPDAIRDRLENSEAVVLVTQPHLISRVHEIRAELPALKHLIVADHDKRPDAGEGELCWNDLMDAASDEFEIVRTDFEDGAVMHYTSGTTGKPKGALHVHKAVLGHYATGKYVLDLHPDDIYWCTADPGWVTGMTYGVIAPLTCGVTSMVDQEEFDPERWYRLLAQESITVWYTAPTAIRMLMKAGTDLARAQAYPRLRFLASVGEPLNPEAVVWGLEAFGLPFHDNWWQTETGAIMVANFASTDIKPGSMGLPFPGIDAAIVRRTGEGAIEVVVEPDTVGELALKTGWPSMFRGYLNNEAKYRESFAGQWYLSGDLARRDAEGYFWFVGRGDDVIKSAGHLISPFEVESALLSHPAVAQAGVIGVPDPVSGAAVKAFVELKPGLEPDARLRQELLAHARRRLGAAVAPRDLAFVESLPRTRSGKIMRRVLRARELGLPEGDLSTLEGGA